MIVNNELSLSLPLSFSLSLSLYLPLSLSLSLSLWSAVLVIGMLLFNTFSEMRDMYTLAKRFDIGPPLKPSTLAPEQRESSLLATYWSASA